MDSSKLLGIFHVLIDGLVKVVFTAGHVLVNVLVELVFVEALRFSHILVEVAVEHVSVVSIHHWAAHSAIETTSVK